MQFLDKQQMLKQFQGIEEKLLFSKVLDQVFLCLKSGRNTFSDFLDPVRSVAFEKAIGRGGEFGGSILSYGGGENCERKILGFSSSENSPLLEVFPLRTLEINYNAKFSRELSHRDFLGSILGLGLERDKIGDIIVLEGRALCYAHTDVAGYICANLEKVANTKVVAKETIIYGGLQTNNESMDERITVSSLRLDSIVSACFHISRSKSSALIEAEKVFVNWKMISSPSKQLNENDVVTLRGYGRIQINEVKGRTKKDRFIIVVTK